MAVEFDERTPIYIQIMNIIKTEIVNKKLKQGDKLPSVREMSEMLKVNPNTIQRAYQELERESITFTQRGMGTFVTENESKITSLKREMASEVIKSFVQGMKNLGFNPDEIIEIVAEYFKEGRK